MLANPSEFKKAHKSWDDLKKNNYDMSYNEEEEEKLKSAIAASLKTVDEEEEDFEEFGEIEEGDDSEQTLKTHRKPLLKRMNQWSRFN